LAEERDAKIHASDGEFRIESESFLKIFLRLRAFLLVEESDAKSVEPQSFRGSGGARGGRRLGDVRMQRREATETGDEEHAGKHEQKSTGSRNFERHQRKFFLDARQRLAKC
jgi:hypothetical protein